MRMENWVGRPSRNKVKGSAKPSTADAPEWAYCTAERFVQLLMKADAKGVTLEQMQGGWDYPAEGDEE